MKRLFLFLVIIGLAAPVSSEEVVSVTAEHLHFSEASRMLIANKDVHVTYKDLEISAPELTINVDENIMGGTGNILLGRGKDQLHATSFTYNLDENKAFVKGIWATLKPNPRVSENVYLRAAELEDNGKAKIGTDGYLTTCDYDPPHYWIHAERFEYYPNDRLVGHNVLIYSPIFFIPFGFWTPYYVYQLGKRNIILLAPIVGKNQIEGWFAKNTVDYYFNAFANGQFYTDWMEKKGLGLGIRNNYQLANTSGNVLLYQVPEQDTGRQSHSFQWNQTATLSDTLALTSSLGSHDMYRITGGRQQDEAQAMGLQYTNLGETAKADVKLVRDVSQNLNRKDLHFENYFNGQKNLLANYSLSNYANRRTEVGDLSSDIKFPQGILLSPSLRYNSTFNDGSPAADQVIRTLLNTQIPGILGAPLLINLDYTLEPNKTIVSPNVRREFLEKMPEAQLNFPDYQWLGITFKNKFLAGQYHENRLISSVDQIRSYTTTKVSIEQSMGSTFLLPLEMSFKPTVKVVQNFYGPGDQLYALAWQYNLTSDWLDCLKTSTTYQNNYSMGNSPFFYDDTLNQKAHSLSETLTLYWADVTKYKWDHRLGWNYQTQKRDDYRTTLTLRPSSNTSFEVNTGFKFEENRVSATDVFYDLITSLQYSPSTNMAIRFDATYDINKGALNRLSNRYLWRFGETWEDQWDVQAEIQYNIYDKLVKLQTITLVKDLHERLIAFSYSDALKEYKIIFTIKAFPEDPVGFSTNKNEAFKFEGLLNNSSVERF